ncbi:MAG: NAD(P)H-dependent oxidoreductase [Brevundimonas sp.]|nr:MAG: NAD(P)H-dependent oxidoreductase [Brevundimonas sp.]
MSQPLIVGIGGAIRPESKTERALAKALALAEGMGCRTRLFGGSDLAAMPLYDPESDAAAEARAALVDAVRQADGVIIASPGYHGSISGLVKNGLDGLEDLRDDARPYFDGRAVGLIVAADGAQAAGSTLSTLRNIVHALRGWPTPLGVVLTGAETDAERLRLMVGQVVGFSQK